ncbi:hypothetical protein XthCFBP4691_05230 [Xanthomonas theicola]|uniref:Uncharacterized protein n=1 Tax=Xanthomonas theicola TaxID=56464 RepID=A0A2S6ZIH6_9XANT|nr:hypothetical protein XthCFBP4691_05230 [Xanthomonas theicola]
MFGQNAEGPAHAIGDIIRLLRAKLDLTPMSALHVLQRERQWRLVHPLRSRKSIDLVDDLLRIDCAYIMHFTTFRIWIQYFRGGGRGFPQEPAGIGKT